MRKLILTTLALSVASTTMAAEVVKLRPQVNAAGHHTMDISAEKLSKLNSLNGHTRYQQMINGIPVYGHHVIRHTTSKKDFYTGHWVKVSKKDRIKFGANQNIISSTEALNISKHAFLKNGLINQDTYQFSNTKSKLYYIVNANGELQKVFIVSFFADVANGGKPARPYYIIDAENKSVLNEWNGLTTDKIGAGPGGNKKIGRYEYGKDYPNFDVTVTHHGNNCEMDNEHVRTIDLDHEYSGNKTFAYECPYHSDDDKVNGGFSPLNDAHFFGSVIFDMYKDWYDTAPLTFKLKMRVHYGTEYENAFWNGSSMTFGDGQYYFYPLVALDVAAHEISHGVTEQNSGLEYWGQSGGLNESFSDMAGKAAEFYMRGSNTWGIGEDITKGSYPLRYMDHPEYDGMSIGDARDYRSGLDVHFSSGVFNRFFYTLAESNDWGTRKAFDAMFKANQSYWEPATNFAEAAEGVLYAAQDLGYNTADVLHAAETVGITCSAEGKLSQTFSCFVESSDDGDDDDDWPETVKK